MEPTSVTHIAPHLPLGDVEQMSDVFLRDKVPFVQNDGDHLTDIRTHFIASIGVDVVVSPKSEPRAENDNFRAGKISYPPP